jgi:LmbE family N-acetylglucosaminyl deacetylase
VNTALVVAAHPDDEVLGCGGTMARLAEEGWQVHVLILAEGVTSRAQARERAHHESELGALSRAAQAAASVLGVVGVRLLSMPDNRMDGIELLDVVKRVEEEIARLHPRRIYTHHRDDLNVDHRIVHDAVAAAARPLPGTCVREVMTFEVPSATEWRLAGSGIPFVPNVFVDIGRTLDRKCKALEAYASEMRQYPHARSLKAVEHLARWRGAGAGMEAAEAFQLARALV